MPFIGYSQEVVDKLESQFERLKKIAQRMDGVVEDFNLNAAEMDFAFSVGIITGTMTDQCASQRKALRLLNLLKVTTSMLLIALVPPSDVSHLQSCMFCVFVSLPFLPAYCLICPLLSLSRRRSWMS